jgi:hypothetical protein
MSFTPSYSSVVGLARSLMLTGLIFTGATNWCDALSISHSHQAVPVTFLLVFYVFRTIFFASRVRSPIQVGTLLLYPLLLIASSYSGIKYVIVFCG